MDSDDHRKSIPELRQERDRLHEMYQRASTRLPDKGANLKHRIASLEELIQQKREQRAKRPSLLRAKTMENRGTGEVLAGQDERRSETTEAGSSLANENVVLPHSVPDKWSANPWDKAKRPVTRESAKRMKLEVVELLTDSDTDMEVEATPIPAPVQHPSTIELLLDNQRVVYPQHGGRGSVQIAPSDLARLEPNQFINDTCINLYIKKIEEDSRHMGRCYIFRTYFYTKLVESTSSSTNNCQNWTKDVNIFDYDYLFVPVYELAHWSLAIICFAGRVGMEDRFSSTSTPCILHLDSVDQDVGHQTTEVGSVLRSYLQAEQDRKNANSTQTFHKKNLPAKRITKIPQQQNCADCGLFLLAYLEHFIYELPLQLNYRKLHELKDKDRPDFLSSQWLDSSNVGLLRSELLYIIYNLYLKQLPSEHPAFDLLFQKLSAFEADTGPKYKTAAILHRERRTLRQRSERKLTTAFNDLSHEMQNRHSMVDDDVEQKIY